MYHVFSKIGNLYQNFCANVTKAVNTLTIGKLEVVQKSDSRSIHLEPNIEFKPVGCAVRTVVHVFLVRTAHPTKT